MYDVKSCVVKEIYNIVNSGITLRNVGVLGQLVDIYKDLENVDYWKHEMLNDSDEDGKDGHIEESIKFVKEAIEASGKGMTVDKDKLEHSINELMGVAENIHKMMGMVRLPDNMATRFKAMFK